MIGEIWNSFYGPPNVFLEVLLIKCRNLQMLSNPSMKIAEPKVGVATIRFHEKYNLRWGFFTESCCLYV
jgi:hypothetical protein